MHALLIPLDLVHRIVVDIITIDRRSGTKDRCQLSRCGFCLGLHRIQLLLRALKHLLFAFDGGQESLEVHCVSLHRGANCEVDVFLGRQIHRQLPDRAVALRSASTSTGRSTSTGMQEATVAVVAAVAELARHASRSTSASRSTRTGAGVRVGTGAVGAAIAELAGSTSRCVRELARRVLVAAVRAELAGS